ncbi:hypothetical protein MBMB1_0600 [Methanobacterium sp. MB1]|nr:hypothetical protein MBMB1_0600 [Methanobacterium sp. MB1]
MLAYLNIPLYLNLNKTPNWAVKRKRLKILRIKRLEYNNLTSRTDLILI